MHNKFFKILSLLVIPIVIFGVVINVTAQTVTITQFNNNLYWNISSTYSGDVKMLQQFLTNQGLYTGPINGSYLTQTYNAVVQFQTKQGINPATGYFGPETRTKANQIISGGSNTTQTVTNTTPSLISSPTPTVTTQQVTTNSTQTVTNTTSTVSTVNNLIPNPSVETANGTKPLNWNTGKWGTNSATFTYPTIGLDGARAVKVSMTAYTSGYAKWFFDDVIIDPGTTYTFSEYYKSNVTTSVSIRWKKKNGSYSYQYLGSPSASNNWSQKTFSFTAPTDVSSMTVFHVISKVGSLDIDSVQLTRMTTTSGDSGGTNTNTTSNGSNITSVNAVLSAWGSWIDVSSWTACSNGTQTKTQQRTRSVITPATNGGTTGVLTETQSLSQNCTVPTSNTTTQSGNSNEIRLTAYLTSYTYWDNTPPGSADISHPVIHNKAGGSGTYNDPITLAVGHVITNGKSTIDYPAGTKFYMPYLRKYFIVEDTCGDGPTPQNGPCHNISTADKGAQVWLDMWIDGSSVSNSSANSCANSLTANHLVIQNPSPNYIVVPGSVISNGVCATKYTDTPVTIN